jgi:hypothetical protein
MAPKADQERGMYRYRVSNAKSIFQDSKSIVEVKGTTDLSTLGRLPLLSSWVLRRRQLLYRSLLDLVRVRHYQNFRKLMPVGYRLGCLGGRVT